MTHALVTGATGFIGYHLVKYLSDRDTEVSCLVRSTSNRHRLESLGPRFVCGDVRDADCLVDALDGVDVVYHLAGLTKCLHASDLIKVNEQGTRNVAAGCARQATPPILIVASSLAAAGPAQDGRPRKETDPPAPVSHYGKSKRAAELAAREFASQVPTTIVRPPIVLGEGDRDGLAMYQTIANLRVHLIPSLGDHLFSVIHAEDLAAALVLAADRGQRSTTEDSAEGVYFATADETPTYAELGRSIGQVLGRPKAWMIRTPGAIVWGIASFNELVSQVLRRPHILNLDKAREATAGSWACSADKLRRDTGFAPAKPLRDRIEQTARWYITEGWLRKPRQMN
jgi:nucleoside-diphosphate-sugar epimerase